jgi:hypothetical protein
MTDCDNLYRHERECKPAPSTSHHPLSLQCNQSFIVRLNSDVDTDGLFFCGKTLMEDLINEKWNSEKLKKLHQAIVGHVIVQQYHT